MFGTIWATTACLVHFLVNSERPAVIRRAFFLNLSGT